MLRPMRPGVGEVYLYIHHLFKIDLRALIWSSSNVRLDRTVGETKPHIVLFHKRSYRFGSTLPLRPQDIEAPQEIRISGTRCVISAFEERIDDDLLHVGH